MAVGDILELVDCQVLHGGALSNVYQYRVDVDSGGGEADNTDDLANGYIAPGSTLTTLQQMQSEELARSCIKTQKVYPTVGPADELQITTLGLQTNPSHPVNVAMIVSLQSTLCTAQGRGRKFIAGIPHDQTLKGNLRNQAFGFFEGWLQILKEVITGPNGGQYRPVIWSRAFPTPTAITEVHLRSRLKGLRPRNRGAV